MKWDNLLSWIKYKKLIKNIFNYPIFMVQKVIIGIMKSNTKAYA